MIWMIEEEERRADVWYIVVLQNRDTMQDLKERHGKVLLDSVIEMCVPVIIRSPSALLRISASRRCSVFA